MSQIPVIRTQQELEELFSRSQKGPVLILKHSLICPVSSAAERRFASFVAGQQAVQVGLIEIQRSRPLSNEVASRTGVRHESPQALLIIDGQAVWHASHGAIDAASLTAALADAPGETVRE